MKAEEVTDEESGELINLSLTQEKDSWKFFQQKKKKHFLRVKNFPVALYKYPSSPEIVMTSSHWTYQSFYSEYPPG